MNKLYLNSASRWKTIFCFLFISLTITLSGFSQNVGINSTGNAPNPDAGLDVDFSNKGLLIPRVSLTSSASPAPLSTHVAGMIVYNTATPPLGDVKNPGFYYNDGTKWVAGMPAGNAIGDMLYWTGTAWNLLPVGTSGQYLTLNTSNIPVWATASTGGVYATLTTTAASTITGIAAASGGNITSDGGLAVLSRGVCWKTTTGPTIADSKTVDGSGNGVFTSNLTGLLPVTTYYVRAYATNSSTTAYGNEISFTTTAVLPTLAATTPANTITGTTATTGGNVTNTGGANITERGICYAISPTVPTTANSKVIDPAPGAGTFTSNLTGLTGYSTYIVRAYATNSIGTAYGTPISFITAVVPPTLVTATATSIGGASAVSGGSVTFNGGGYQNQMAYGIAYSTTPNAVSPLRAVTSSTNYSYPTTINPYTTNITGLIANTTYYIRSFLDLYRISPAGWVTVYGNELSFTTTGPSVPVVASTTAITGISDRTGNSGGAITSDGGSAITAKGVCWSTNPNPTLGLGNFTSNGTGTASFVSNISGLTGSTTYYVRAYATNAIGTSYAPVDISFTTWVTAPYTLGQNIGYGWCAYVDATGHGFIVSPDIPSTVGWGCPGISILTGTAVGTGQANTALILSSCATRPIAASVATSYNGGGFTDWYLPSSGEWALIAAKYTLFGFGGGYNNYYTSTPYSSLTYATTYFYTGSQAYQNGAQRVPGANDYVNYLRVIRNF